MLLLGAAASHAQVALTASGGTTGAGLHASVRVQSGLNARFGVNALNYSTNRAVSDVEYDLKLRLMTVEALLDYFPAGGSFRLSGGLVHNGNKAEVAARPAGGTFTFNNNVYDAATVGTVEGSVKFRTLAPYLGIGWGNPLAAGKGWSFSTDVGVILHGSPRTNLASSGCTASAEVCARLANDVEAENQALREDARDFKAFPVIRVGLSYRF
ncbi:conserved hypothetical protein [Ramlibacter tataouinensis TTB310]|uniref:Uncharacterized protein n=1 Tax=Ramlibacter tataouinensis (strain ATCC BAA-407 / DSM 14655 / LMG 21543 / TTB310) TaxID=365046 RepID=F5XZF5_RAMTT|nr:conserved hypothetical protein [Ramlibacter tataouinensis TTB310]